MIEQQLQERLLAVYFIGDILQGISLLDEEGYGCSYNVAERTDLTRVSGSAEGTNLGVPDDNRLVGAFLFKPSILPASTIVPVDSALTVP
ncbi:hypothetical protein D3C80_1539860 [compost metagenome]